MLRDFVSRTMKQDETLKAIREEINQLTGAGKQGTQWSRSSVEPHPPELSLLPVANMENVWAVEACLSCPENFNVFVSAAPAIHNKLGLCALQLVESWSLQGRCTELSFRPTANSTPASSASNRG